ncbi:MULTISPECIES: DUF2304 domain-containing protein [Rothia]|uniref:DUF2304 domain-containing protein n=1 Tax=Rothia endophytica TaxID=1324766 RepID=A0ABP9BUW8_9MICC|nr:DUF2304 domain-containing protein [Rothia sp. P100]MCM3510860.1 DUF2304 domain-containing protein [Rothia sp. P100]SLF17801.1 Uncharacterized conserved protein [Mycobacteroides abscessus subsp. bolletii]
MSVNIFFLILTLCLVIMVLAQVRNQKMKEKYAALWLIVSAIIVVLTVFPRLLDWLADLVGIETPVNLLFLLAIIMLIAVTLHLTQALSRLTEDTRILAEAAAIKDLEVRQLQDRVAAMENRFEN